MKLCLGRSAELTFVIVSRKQSWDFELEQERFMRWRSCRRSFTVCMNYSDFWIEVLTERSVDSNDIIAR